MRGCRLIIPADLQANVLRQLHSSHQGIVWWPQLSKKLEEVVKRCPECVKHQPPSIEPHLSTPLPSLPWQRVATDLFEWKKSNYLVIVDYFSRWIEIAQLEQMTPKCVIEHIGSIFARYGIPEILFPTMDPNTVQISSSSLPRIMGLPAAPTTRNLMGKRSEQ